MKKSDGKENRKHIQAPHEKRKKIYAWHCGPVRNSKIPEINRLPHPEVAICAVGEGDSLGTKGGIKVSGHCPPHLTRGGRGICDQPL